MDIVQATKKAMKSGKGITRHEFVTNTQTGVWFLPTDTILGYVIISKDQITP